MATWDDFANFMRTEYKITTDDGTFLALVFDLGDGRSQLLHVSRGLMPNNGEEFAEIASPIGSAESVDVSALLKDAAKLVVGGVVQYGDTLVLRHAVPLANIEPNELVNPLEAITHAADSLEKKYTGADKH